MKEYDVKITETLEKTVTVQAESHDAAEEQVRAAYYNSEYILDSENFTGVAFGTTEEREVQKEQADTMNVLLVKPFMYPQAVQIGCELEDLQKAVGGDIEATYPFNEPVALVMHDEGKLVGKELNRALRDDDGDIYDIIAGDFLVVGLGEDDFCSLSPELMKQFEEHFHQPETFVRMGRSIMALPLPDDMVKKEDTLVWDGTERIRFCLRHFLGADADDYTYEALKLFLLGAISRAFQPGCKFEIMLCLVGGQGAGKSTFFRLLAVRDEWFSDDLRKLDDDNVYRKLQGHWIIEMSEMMATANAKSIEEIKSFLSRQKEVYKIPYETHPADRPRQCVFGGTSNALDFLPLDRSGNRRFIPVMVYPEQAEVHILEDEAASRAYIEQMWAEAMEIYRSGRFKLAFSPAMQRYLKEHQRDFMPEDTKAGMIQAYLDKYTGSMVCSKQLYKEALNHAFDEPKQWEIREINEIMNQCIDRWRYFPNPRMFSEYGRQKGWERENPATDSGNPSEKTMDGFVEVTEQMELPF